MADRRKTSRTKGRRTVGQGGFTLIEMIVSLVLLGVLTAFAGMGVVSLVEAFWLTRMNAETTQKGQLAMSRLAKEFTHIRYVTAGSATSITYTSYRQGVPAVHTVSLSGDLLTLDGDALTDRVAQFELGYLDSNSSAKQPAWSASTRILEFAIHLRGANNAVVVFRNRVRPRNL